jgi:hypothetical protein
MKKTKVTVACCALIAPLAFCTSAFAGPSENVVQPATQQPVTKTVRKMCLVVESGSRIPQPCNRLAAIPTTANPMTIYGHRPGR